MATNVQFEQSPTTDLTLVVEDKKLFVNRSLLMIASPVFNKMLTADFKEKDAQEINLPGKKAFDVEAFLRCIYPDIMEEIDNTNVYRVLPLAEEYQCHKLKEKCENYLVHMVYEKGKPLKPAIRCMLMSLTYDLKKLLEASADVLSEKYLSTLERNWGEIPKEGRLKMCMERIKKLEEFGAMAKNSLDMIKYSYECRKCYEEGKIKDREYAKLINAEFEKVHKST